MRSFLLNPALLAALAIMAACSDGEVAVDDVAQSIAGGEYTDEFPAVVSLRVEGGRFTYFTGTVISPRVVLTCAHGFEAEDGESIGIDSGVVMFGTHTSGNNADPDRTVAIEAYRVHPGYAPHWPSDVALVLLAEDADVEPIEVNTEDVATFLEPGDPVRIVGYGVDDGGFAGRRMTVVRPIHDVTPRFLTYDRGDVGPRPGDSGGPHLVERDGHLQVLATTIGWSNLFDIEMRADVHWDTFIAPTLAAWEGPCRRDGTCRVDGCVYPDPDCGDCGLDGTCSTGCELRDPDCAAMSSFTPCESDADCATGLCVDALDDPRVRYCAWPCDDLPRTGCDYDFTCEESARHAATGQRACFYEGPTPSTQGASCVFDDQCLSGYCHEPDGICAEACARAADCGEPYACVEGASGTVCALTEWAPAADGGCAVARPGHGHGGWVWLAGLLALTVARLGRRRRWHLR